MQTRLKSGVQQYNIQVGGQIGGLQRLLTQAQPHISSYHRDRISITAGHQLRQAANEMPEHVASQVATGIPNEFNFQPWARAFEKVRRQLEWDFNSNGDDQAKQMWRGPVQQQLEVLRNTYTTEGILNPPDLFSGS